MWKTGKTMDESVRLAFDVISVLIVLPAAVGLGLVVTQMFRKNRDDGARPERAESPCGDHDV